MYILNHIDWLYRIWQYRGKSLSCLITFIQYDVPIGCTNALVGKFPELVGNPLESVVFFRGRLRCYWPSGSTQTLLVEKYMLKNREIFPDDIPIISRKKNNTLKKNTIWWISQFVALYPMISVVFTTSFLLTYFLDTIIPRNLTEQI